MEEASLDFLSWDQIIMDLRKLDREDVAHGIVAKYPNLDDFLALSFKDMAANFTTDGTSVPFLFDLYLEAGLNYYLEQNPSHREWFLNAEKILLNFAEKSKSNGVEEGVLKVRGLVTVTLPSVIPFDDNHLRTWGIRVDQRLLPEIFRYLLTDPLPDESLQSSQEFIIAMGKILYGNDRQSGYYGSRGSILNPCIAKASSHLQDATKVRALALMGLLRKVSASVRSDSDFDFYHMDGKALLRYYGMHV